MKLNRNTFLWIAVAFIALMYFSQMNTIPKEAVADVEGKYCVENKDCTCLGKFEEQGTTYTTQAWGIGVGQCVNNACDMGYCIDVEPIGDWMKDNPLHWLKSNPIWLLAGLAIIVVYFVLPKN